MPCIIWPLIMYFSITLHWVIFNSLGSTKFLSSGFAAVNCSLKKFTPYPSFLFIFQSSVSPSQLSPRFGWDFCFILCFHHILSHSQLSQQMWSECLVCARHHSPCWSYNLWPIQSSEHMEFSFKWRQYLWQL